MFYQILHSPQVKRCAIINYKYGISKWLHELPNDLRKFECIRKVSKPPKNDRLVPSPAAKMKNLSILDKNSWKTEIKPFPQCATPRGNQSRSRISRKWLPLEILPRSQLAPEKFAPLCNRLSDPLTEVEA